jgi:NADH-quinone oxidoreductase subunit N
LLTLHDKLRDVLGSLQGIVPEVVLSLFFLFIVLADLIAAQRYKGWLLPSLTIAGFLITFFTVVRTAGLEPGQQESLFLDMLKLNGRIVLFKCIFLVAGIITVLMTTISQLPVKKRPAGEYYAVLIALILGLHLTVMASNLLFIYLAIELVSISSYILSGFNFNLKGAEASMKYLLFGALASGVMLYGMSFLYGFTGTLNITSLAFAEGLAATNQLAVFFALALTSVGFLFKIGAVPLHIWTPDVYEGAPAPVAAFFSVAPKAAGLAVMLNFAAALNNTLSQGYLFNLLVIVALLSVTIGNLSALWQNNGRRLLAYSSIAHAGFLLIGVVAFSEAGLRSLYFYLCIYLFMNFAAFLLFQLVAGHTDEEDMRAFKGLGKENPLFGIAMLVIMISLTGLPPTAGFNAKLFIFTSLWEAYDATRNEFMLWLFVLGLLNTVISLFYYLKIPFYMFFREKESSVIINFSFFYKIFAFVLIIPLLILFFKADWLMILISR